MSDSIIRLDQFLKLSGLIATGGQAKLIIQGGEVMVNGQIETRRRRQLQPGDVVDWHEQQVVVELSTDSPDEESSLE